MPVVLSTRTTNGTTLLSGVRPATATQADAATTEATSAIDHARRALRLRLRARSCSKVRTSLK